MDCIRLLDTGPSTGASFIQDPRGRGDYFLIMRPKAAAKYNRQHRATIDRIGPLERIKLLDIGPSTRAGSIHPRGRRDYLNKNAAHSTFEWAVGWGPTAWAERASAPSRRRGVACERASVRASERASKISLGPGKAHVSRSIRYSFLS